MVRVKAKKASKTKGEPKRATLKAVPISIRLAKPTIADVALWSWSRTPLEL